MSNNYRLVASNLLALGFLALAFCHDIRRDRAHFKRIFDPRPHLWALVR